METVSKERNYGVDLFRIVSMLMVVTLHVLNRGGALGAAVKGSAEWYAGWVLEVICFGAVDCYALISGFVCYGRRHKYSRALYVWAQVFFYTALAAAIFFGTGMWEVTEEAVAYSFSPIFHNHYWYITSYIGMTFFIPFMNRAAESVSGRDAAIFTGASVVLFMVVPRFVGTSVFTLSSGYSMIWLMILYMIGAFIRRFHVGEGVPRWTILLFCICSWAVTWVTRTYWGNDELVSYISPTIFAASAGLLILFSRLRIKNRVPVWLIKTFSPATLGVYIIHVNYFIWRLYMLNFAVKFAGGGLLRYLGLTLGSALAIYAVLSVVDVCRIKLFELCRVPRALAALDKWLDRFEDKEVQDTNQTGS